MQRMLLLVFSFFPSNFPPNHLGNNNTLDNNSCAQCGIWQSVHHKKMTAFGQYVGQHLPTTCGQYDFGLHQLGSMDIGPIWAHGPQRCRSTHTLPCIASDTPAKGFLLTDSLSRLLSTASETQSRGVCMDNYYCTLMGTKE